MNSGCSTGTGDMNTAAGAAQDLGAAGDIDFSGAIAPDLQCPYAFGGVYRGVCSQVDGRLHGRIG
ncbi:MAG: hypothetical protein MESAZ_00426 [Saezia sanguinis]